MSDRFEIVDGETGEIYGAPPRAVVFKRVSSLSGLFRKAARFATGTPEEAALVRIFDAGSGGRGLRAWWSGDCERPRRLRLAEYPRPDGTVGRMADLSVRCGQCDPCRDAKRRKRQFRGVMECLAGGAAGAAKGAPHEDAHLVPGCRTWMVTLTFDGDARLRLRALADRLREDAEARCREASGQSDEPLPSSADALGRRLAPLLRAGPAPSDRSRSPEQQAKDEQARRRRFGLEHDTEAKAERHWWFRAAHRMASDFMRRLRQSRPRSEGQVPLRVSIAVEPHKRDGFPHMHLLVHEQGVVLRKGTLVRCWSRRRDGAPAGGADPQAELVPLGAITCRLVGGHRIVMGKPVRQPIRRAAFYAAKYSAKEGTLWRASKGYGTLSAERKGAALAAPGADGDWLREALRRLEAADQVEAVVEAAEEIAEAGEDVAPFTVADPPPPEVMGSREGRSGLPPPLAPPGPA